MKHYDCLAPGSMLVEIDRVPRLIGEDDGGEPITDVGTDGVEVDFGKPLGGVAWKGHALSIRSTQKK